MYLLDIFGLKANVLGGLVEGLAPEYIQKSIGKVNVLLNNTSLEIVCPIPDYFPTKVNLFSGGLRDRSNIHDVLWKVGPLSLHHSWSYICLSSFPKHFCPILMYTVCTVNSRKKLISLDVVWCQRAVNRINVDHPRKRSKQWPTFAYILGRIYM